MNRAQSHLCSLAALYQNVAGMCSTREEQAEVVDALNEAIKAIDTLMRIRAALLSSAPPTPPHDAIRAAVHAAVGKYDHLLNGAAMASIRDEVTAAAIRAAEGQ